MQFEIWKSSTVHNSIEGTYERIVEECDEVGHASLNGTCTESNAGRTEVREEDEDSRMELHFARETLFC